MGFKETYNLFLVELFFLSCLEVQIIEQGLDNTKS
jgi:hypothetical protein